MNYWVFIFLLLLPAYSFGQVQMQKLKEKAQSGNAIAQYELGSEYLFGDNVEEDDQQAFYWLNKSAQQGVPSALHLLQVLS